MKEFEKYDIIDINITIMAEVINEMDLLKNYYSIYSTIHNDIKDLIFDMVNSNPDKVQDIYKVVKALTV